MSYKKLCVFLLILAMASMKNAAACRYIGCGPWEIAENWDCGGGPTEPPRLPGPDDDARINWGCTVTVSSAVPTVFRVLVGCDESGTLHVQAGGTLSMSDCAMVAVGGNPNTGTLNVDAGATVDIGSHLWAAEVAGSVGNINVSGTVNVGGILGLGSVGFIPGGVAFLNVLDGGVLNLSNIHGDGSSIQPGSVLDICGSGLVTLPADFEVIVNLYVDAGRITACGGACTVVITVIYDGMGNPLQTWITAECPTLTVLAPNGGEVLTAGNIYPITWDTEGTVADVLIEYSVDNGSAWTPVDPCNTGNTGSYNWLVPDVNSSQCLVRVSDASNPDVNDISDGLFTIFTCQGPIVGDLNEDCHVDFRDFALFAGHWSECGNPFDPDCGVP
jgi:hypothetical protein